jgi:hypothetical protein
MNHDRRDHPDMRDDAPGRIPESLINAAMDGELDKDIQREIGDALQYDPIRRQEVHETRDAINALRMPIEAPDLSDRVLDRAHRHRRFIPAKLRNHVRTGRVVMAAALLITLFGVAGLQRMYPRLTTIAAHQTPVSNVEDAIEQNTQQLAQTVTGEIKVFADCVATPVRSLFADSLEKPGNTQHNYSLAIRHTAPSNSEQLTNASFPAAHADVLASTHPTYAVVSLVASQNQPLPRVFRNDRNNQFVLMSWTPSPAPRPEPEPESLEFP